MGYYKNIVIESSETARLAKLNAQQQELRETLSLAISALEGLVNCDNDGLAYRCQDIDGLVAIDAMSKVLRQMDQQSAEPAPKLERQQ